MTDCLRRIEDHKEVKPLRKPSVNKLMIFFHFLNIVQIYAKVDQKMLMDILENQCLGKSLV